jgi:RNA-directed DNA polymerase
VSPRTETSYEAERPGEVAQHTEARGSGRTVDGGVVQLQFAFLSGETCSSERSSRCIDASATSGAHAPSEAATGRLEQEGRGGPRTLSTSAQKPTGPVEARRRADCTEPHEDLMRWILSRRNMTRAYERVKANRGAPGVDGMTVDEFLDYARQHWDGIRSALRSGRYQPSPVRRTEIPKPTGGTRPLGIPTVLDRVIQQAIAQVLTPICEAFFSDHSHGFRPGRKAHDAVRYVQQARRNGYRFAVDADLSKFFDRVNHDVLMRMLARHVKDPVLLRLIGKYLRAGVVIDGNVEATTAGVPQGGPLSPLLANVVLHELDCELERRGHCFARYADDFVILVKSHRAGERVLRSVQHFLAKRLRLELNAAKSGVVPILTVRCPVLTQLRVLKRVTRASTFSACWDTCPQHTGASQRFSGENRDDCENRRRSSPHTTFQHLNR